MSKFIKSLSLTLAMMICIVQAAFAADLQHAQYLGGGYIVGTSNLGTVEIYVPYSTVDSWGTTAGGQLCNITSSTVSGIMYTSNGTQYQFRCAGYSTPEYRSSNNYTYTAIGVTVTDSNLNIATDFPVKSTWKQHYQLIIIGILGVVIICIMRSKH